MPLTNPNYLLDSTWTGKVLSGVAAVSLYQYAALANVKVTIIVGVGTAAKPAAGNGNYEFYLSRQWVGAGASRPCLPKTTVPVAAGITQFEVVTIGVQLKTGDVIDFYGKGLAGDGDVNGTIRIIQEQPSVFNAAADNVLVSALAGITLLANWLRGFMRSDPMNAAAKLEVNAGGGLYDEADHSNQAIGDNIPPAPPATVTVGDLTQAALAKFVNTDTLEVAVTPGSVADFAGCNAVGFPAGAIEFTYTVLGPGAIPIEGASVWISTDNPAVNIVWRGETDAFGVARDVRNMKPFLDVGPYFFWVQHDNFTGTLPDLEVVS